MTVATLELIHASKPDFAEGFCLFLTAERSWVSVSGAV